jgi:protein-S-isoprenylcysteine O-methyltransferase Ste14
VLASDFEFRHRTWFIFGIFCVGLACYWLDPKVSGVLLARSLRSHIALLQTLSLQTSIRAVFLVGAFIVTLGGLIRAWGGAYLRAEVVHDSSVRTERLVADGPFRYSRNPLYLGLLIGVFGAGLLCSRTGWIIQMVLAIVFCYRLIFREEAELFRVQGDRFVAYCRAVPRLFPALNPRVSASGALPDWHEAFTAQTTWWTIAAGEVGYAVTLRLGIALLVALAGVPIKVVQKRARSIKARGRKEAASASISVIDK